MIAFPSTTYVGRVLPKEAFYQRLALNNELKGKFISDVQHITLQNSLTAATLRLEPCEQVTEILLLVIDLKRRDYDLRIIETIARQNPHKLVFFLRYEGKGQLAILYNKLYFLPWKPWDKLTLEARGFTLDEVWDGFLEQIALAEEKTSLSELPVEKRIARMEARRKLQKEIDKAEKLARAEKQPKKRFEMYLWVLKLKQDMDGII